MKKIIYSLVIMIAAGSLFTSCIEQEEPSGVYELRIAKKAYLESLGQAKLIYANAEKAKADAQAAKDQATAAMTQADAKAKEIENQLAEINNKVADVKAQNAIDSLKAYKEKVLADAEAATVKAQADLAKAEAAYKNAVDSLAAAAYLVAPEVQAVIDEATDAYKNALAKQDSVQYALYKADSTLYFFKKYAAEGKDEQGVEDEDYASVEYWQDSIATLQEIIAGIEENVAKVKTFQTENEWAALLKEYQDKIDAANAKLSAITTEIAAYNAKTFTAAKIAYQEKVHNYIEEGPDAPEDPEYAELEEAFEFELTGGKTVAGNFPNRLDEYLNGLTSMMTFTANPPKVTIIEGTKANVIDSILNQNNNQSLNSVIAALKRELVIKADTTVNKVIEDSIKVLKSKDTEANDKFQSDYDSLRNFYSKAKDQFKEDTNAVRKAAEDVAKAINDYKAHKNAETPSLAKADTVKLFEALIKYGEATSDKMRVQDTIKYTAADNLGNFKVMAIPLTAIKLEDIAIIKNSGKWSSVYGAKNSSNDIAGNTLNDPLLRIINTLFRGTATVTEDTGKARWTVGYKINSTENEGYNFDGQDETITVAHFALIDTMRAPNHGFANSTAQTKWNTIIARFFGTKPATVKANQDDYDDAIKDINWSAATFDGLIEFVPYGASDWAIKYTRELAEVVKEITNYDGSIDNMNDNGFFATSYAKGILSNLENSDYTELANMYRYKPQIAALEKTFKGDDAEILAGLEALADTLAKVRATYSEADSTAAADWAADTLAFATYYCALYGYEPTRDDAEDVKDGGVGYLNFSIGDVPNIFIYIEEGDIAGLAVDWFKEAFAECNDMFADWDARKDEAIHELIVNWQIAGPISKLYRAARYDFREDNGMTKQAFKDYLNKTVEELTEEYTGKIQDCEECIKTIESGFNFYTYQLNKYEKAVADCQAALESAKAETALKKAAFDAIIAQYAK